MEFFVDAPDYLLLHNLALFPISGTVNAIASNLNYPERYDQSNA